MLPLHDKVFLISRRWYHHASHSGYDILCNFIGTTLTSRPVPDFFLPNRILWKMTHDMPGYDRTGAALELLAMKHMASHKKCIYHFLYGENSYNYLGYLNGWRGHKVVVTFHHPPKKFAEFNRTVDPIRRLSNVIVVGRNQIASLEDILPNNRIHFIPYAVDTTYFAPLGLNNEREKNTCLFVGAHLRDFETLYSIIENAWITYPNIKFNIVIIPADRDKLRGLVGNYQIFNNIDEPTLLNMYQRASLLIMPLQDTTANTSVLEAMSCGLPMVVTDIGAIRDYANEDCARFVSPFNPGEMLDAIVSLLKSDQDRKMMGENAREHAKKFDWRLAAEKLHNFYDQIIN
jgi:glycosyltransferase involved in cell wall biosynthesis